ncbi:MAG TPA: transporter substrate-binding domain-containing protein [Burkholderiaceae bacterium]
MHRNRIALICGLLIGMQARAESAAPVTVHYYERKPFHYADASNRVVGLLVAPTEQSFSKADIPIVWQLTPINRTLATIKANRGRDCTTGWYKSSEREAFARFTQPIYVDKPLVVFTRADFDARNGVTARELLARPHTRLLLKQGFVHGHYLDPLIDKMPPAQVQRVADEIPSMVKMVRAGIADIIIVTEEEVNLYINSPAMAADGIRALRLPDLSEREYRYIACSKQVPAEDIDKLNAAIAGLSPELRGLAPRKP